MKSAPTIVAAWHFSVIVGSVLRAFGGGISREMDCRYSGMAYLSRMER